INPFVSLKKPIETLHFTLRWEEVGGLLQRSSGRVDQLHVQLQDGSHQQMSNVFTSGRARRGLSQSLGELIPLHNSLMGRSAIATLTSRNKRGKLIFNGNQQQMCRVVLPREQVNLFNAVLGDLSMFMSCVLLTKQNIVAVWGGISVYVVNYGKAMEKLGTGRRHDVKLRAFDNAKYCRFCIQEIEDGDEIFLGVGSDYLFTVKMVCTTLQMVSQFSETVKRDKICFATNRIITAKDHASVQLNI
ncbi:hypothetical protein MKW98_024206, partial [Papaver atlanticum]